MWTPALWGQRQNVCEGRSLISGHALKNSREGVLPYNLEIKLVFVMDRAMWSVQDIKRTL